MDEFDEKPHDRQPTRLLLARALRRARGSLLWERLWPALASVAIVLGLFLAFSWAGLWLILPPLARAIGLVIFVLAGASYCALQLLSFTTMIFYALRRFDLTNLIGIGSSLASAIGVILILRMGGQLLAVAVWIVAVNWISFLIAALAIRRLNPQLHFGGGRLQWAWLRPHVSFGLWSQMANLADVVHMQSGSLLIGTVLGSSAIAPYAVGQKLPLVTARVQGKAAEVLFPAASQAAQSNSLEATRQILATGTRWMVILMVPLYLGLAMVAPQLLQIWIGQTGAEEVIVLRLTCSAGRC